MESTVRAEIERGTYPSAAFALVHKGRIIYENGLGWADKERKRGSTADTPYPLASVSKPLVATAVMMLAEQGRIDLDAPALRYLGDVVAPDSSGPAYSVRQLLNHTSGLGTYASIIWRDQGAPAKGREERFRRYGLAIQPPGTLFEYSNLGYGLLGHIIARQSGQGLGDFLKSRLFEPLGMHNSLLVDGFSVPANAARKYDAAGAPLIESWNDTPGAGNIYASAHDLALFGAFHLAGDPPGSTPLLSARHKLLMRSFVEPGAFFPYYGSSHYGLGWYFRTGPRGEPVVWHEGGMPGASALLLLLPEQSIAVAVVINANDVNVQAQAVANALIQGIEPAYQAVSFTATDGFAPLTNQPAFPGDWEGSVRIDGKDLPCTLRFDRDGVVQAQFPGRSKSDLLPAEVEWLPSLVRGDLLVATFAATLPAADVEQKAGGYVLVRLVRRGDELSGAFVAYSSATRLEHLFPFAAHFRRKTAPALTASPEAARRPGSSPGSR